ncbi:MAG: HD domain-containing protein [Peptococcaceae bacterium]|nr:HD domain-containing protein [Peptococcaceae bacterium]
MTWKAKLYLFVIYLVGLSIAFYAFSKLDKNILLIVILWVIIATPFEIKPIQVSTDWHYTLSFAIHLSLLIIYGSWIAITVAAFVTSIADLLGKKGPVKLIFNVSQFSITLYLTGTVYNLFKNRDIPFLLPDDLLAFICASLIYVVINTLLVAVIVALTSNRSVFYLLKRDARMVVMFFLSLVPISMLMVILYKEHHPLTMLLIIPPLAFTHTSFRNYASLKIETRKTLEILADFVDCRDRYTAEHSKRVAQYANLISEEMNLSDSDKELIELAGRVHDLGKITISDSILLKSGKLTGEEKKIVQSHPEVAYKILRPLQMYKRGSIIIRDHHERCDGKGYPRGLKDKSIHIGAKIIAVADAYDAMTSDRPYRKAMTKEEAIAELEANSGTQFDPGVVKAFINILKKRD